MCTGGYFANGRPASVPSDDVTAICDINAGFVKRSLDFPGLVNRVQLRMKLPTECVKRKFGDFGANRKHKAIP